MPRPRMLSLAMAVSIVLAASAATPIVAQDEAPLAPPVATPNPEPLEVPTGDGTGVRLTTDLGDVVIGLFTESAPVASENFINLVEAGYYDGIGFHRVVEGFVIQGGDPSGDGTGGPGYTIRDEQVVGEYGRGIVAMARTPQPDSQGSQFFIVLDDGARPALESANTYTIFGRVIEGMDVVDAIAGHAQGDVIEDPVIIQAATIEQVELPAEPTPEPPTAAELAADELAAMLPSQLAGLDIGQQATFTADQIRSQLPADALAPLEEAAQANGGDMERLSIVQASAGQGEESATIAAGSVPGAAAESVEAAMMGLILGPVEGSVSDEVVADRAVRQVALPQAEEAGQVAYVISSGDVVWFVIARPDDAEAIVAALPEG